MSDPERLLDHASDLERRLLASALDEAPPDHLLARTLEVVGVSSAAAQVAKAGTANGVAGGGVLGAAGVGALLGVFVVAGAQVASSFFPARPPAGPEVALSSPLRSPPRPESPAAPVPPALSAAPVPDAVAPRVVSSAGHEHGRAHVSALTVEIELLDEARAALGEGDPERALARLDRYAREMPAGQLVHEADALRAEAQRALAAGHDGGRLPGAAGTRDP